ncbi:Xaa-Pro peptidase family protein [Salarchaeum sp. JOR-1]|uniref:M24 family metallopeptidase n=1 Tax=Salarchaeum sp. JOR-1 TaxID=2599399 RepID=UPI0011983D77|nr:M24 family metallopeptidase [Salarchaeum sp. JOR-1]QDX39915.1 aminopeptidase P family protein [Salarchaeum sp. JOR-1]
MVAPETTFAFLYDELEARDATGFVHVGGRFDDALRYLTRFSGPAERYAFVFVGGDAVLCAPDGFERQARREFAGDYVYTPGDLRADTPGGRAVEVLEAYDADGTVLVPQDVPHDAAVRLERAGFDLASTDAVARERVVKEPEEIEALRKAQAAAAAGMRRAETVLAAADAGAADDALRFDGGRLTTTRLRREVDAALVREGATPRENTVVAAGGACTDRHFRGDVPVRPGETVVVDVSPRGPHGYHGALTRTFVVDSEGGWERRAFLAVESAQAAGLDELSGGADASLVHEETAAEIGAYGFPAGYGDTGFTHGTGYGVGVSSREAPAVPSDTPLEPGTVLAVEPGVYDPSEGGVRLGDLVVVTDGGFEYLREYPRAFTPRA